MAILRLISLGCGENMGCIMYGGGNFESLDSSD